MISTTLLVASLVFNAVSSLGAPIRISTIESPVVSRAEISEPVLSRSEFVEVEPQVKRSNLGRFTRRTVRLAREADIDIETRDTASPSVEARDSLPEIERVVRRFPRAHLYNFYEKRSEHPAPRDIPEDSGLERRYPRQALHARYVKREEGTPPASEAAGEAPADPAAAKPTGADGEAAPEAPPAVAPAPSPSATVAGGAGAAASPTASSSTSGTPSATTTSASSTETAPTTPSATTTSTKADATASAGGEAPVQPTAAASTPSSSSATPIATPKVDSAADIAGIVSAIEKNHVNGGFQNGQTTKETTVIVSKVTYNSDANKPPVVSASTTTLGQPAPSSTSTPAEDPTSGDKKATPPKEADPSKPSGFTDPPKAAPELAKASPEGAPAPAEASPEASPAVEPRSIFRRNLGFSGAAFASLKRNLSDLD